MALRCPQCEERVPWRQRWLGVGFSSTWSCRRCGAILKFDDDHRRWLTLPILGCLPAIWLLKPQKVIPPMVYLPVIGVFCLGGFILLFVADRATIVRYGSGRCSQCGYDLTGLTSGRCPECGRKVEPGKTTCTVAEEPPT